jgi:hypothetical protein
MDFAVMEPFNQRIAMRYHMTGLNSEQSKHYRPFRTVLGTVFVVALDALS